jgi:hypothetical protein
MKDNVLRSFEMRHVIHDIRFSSGQWTGCDVTYGAVPKVIRNNRKLRHIHVNTQYRLFLHTVHRVQHSYTDEIHIRIEVEHTGVRMQQGHTGVSTLQLKDTNRNQKYIFSCNFIITDIKINYQCQLYFNCMNILTSRQIHLVYNFVTYLIAMFIVCHYMYGLVCLVSDSLWRWLI